MVEYYVKVPKEKAKFFAELLENLGLESEQLMDSEMDDTLESNIEEVYFTDSDD